MTKLLATCLTDNLRDIRDRAILTVACASGGHGRSEIAGLGIEQVTVEAPVKVPDGVPLPSFAVHLGRAKTTMGEETMWSILLIDRSKH